MRTIGIRDLKQNLSHNIRAAQAGETVMISDRGRVVACLSPPRSGSEDRNQDLFKRLERQGLFTPALHPPGPPPCVPRGTMSLEELLSGLDEDRADRW